jgi:hypothetical protein
MPKTPSFLLQKIANILVLLVLVAVPFADAGTPHKPPVPLFGHVSAPCAANTAQADYVPGVDVDGNRIAPADIDGGTTLDLRDIAVNPVVPVGHGRNRSAVVVRGVKLAGQTPVCARIKQSREPSFPKRPR